MSSNQLSNIINFTFNFHKSMGNDLMDMDKDYIIEKWNKYIGLYYAFKDVEIDIRTNNIIQIWANKWRCSTSELSIIKPIIHLIVRLNQKPLWGISQINIEELVQIFSEVMYVETITNVKYDSNHHLVKEEVSKFLDRNKRQLNLLILDSE
jgi:hypothetical protein